MKLPEPVSKKTRGKINVSEDRLEDRKTEVVSKLNMAYLKTELEDNIQKMQGMLKRYNEIKGALYKYRE